MIVVHTLAPAALIRLYYLCAEVDQLWSEKCILAARNMLLIIGQVSDMDIEFLDPIVACCWASAAHFFIREIAQMKNDNSLPQIRTLFVPPIRVILALLPLLPTSPIHSNSTLPLPSRTRASPARHPHLLPQLWSTTLLQVQGVPPDFLPSPPAPCLASIATAHCRCKIAPGPCLPPLHHTLALRSKIILTSLVHVFAPHLANICRQLARRPHIITIRPLCTPPSFLASPNFSVHA